MTSIANPKISLRSVVAAALLAVVITAVLAAPRPAHAQLIQALLGDNDDNDNPSQPPANGTVWDEKQLERLDRNVRRIERRVDGIESKGAPPVLIAPDPEVQALQATAGSLSSKLADSAGAVTALTGQLEETQHHTQVLQQQVAALTARTDDLIRRANATEAHLNTIDTALAPPPPPPPSQGTADSDFAQAVNLMASGQDDEAERAFTAFTTTWPEAAQLPQAWFRLGELRATRKDTSGAVAAFATALKGWPKTPWAPEATVDLAAALSDSHRPEEACLALAKFEASYVRMADGQVRTMANRVKADNRCR
jgi:TolA-binding protein